MEYSYRNGKAPYFFWFIFYFLLFWALTGFNAIAFIVLLSIYAISIIFAFSPAAEIFWRMVNGVRPLRIRNEKLRLLPLFKEVYIEAVKKEENLSRSIRLYIKEDMNINAFAFGQKTLVITRGSIELLSDDCLKGLMVHELGHFAHDDTVAVLITSVGNFFYSMLMKYLTDLKKAVDTNKKNSLLMGCVKSVVDVIYYLFRGIQFLSDLILMYASRQNEYLADLFALDCGYGAEMAEVLIQIYQMMINKPQKIKAIINSSHPPITKRIESLEMILYKK